jgi:modulator of FtsH protease
MNDWENFLLGELGASATLTGLIFVGVSVNLMKITTRATLTNRALEALVALIVVLFISSLLLIPGQTFLAVGIEVLLIGLINWMVVGLLQLDSLHKMQPQYRLQFIPYIVLSQLAALSFVIAGIVLLILGTGGLYWIVAATLLSFLAAFTDAWILLIEINR